MSLRRQLFVLGLLLLILPLVGWRVAQQVEQFLRDAEQRALVATAESLARSFSDIELGQGEQGYYVKRIDYRLTADGYPDEWRYWRRWQQTFAVPAQGLRLDALWVEDDRRLYGLLEVNYSVRPKVAGRVELRLQNRRGQRSYWLEPSGAGGLNVSHSGEDPDSDLIPPIHGSWRTHDSGYVVELDIPASLVDQLAIIAVASGDPTTGAPQVRVGNVDGMLPLLRSPPAWQQRLAALSPDNKRVWLLDNVGSVRASAGQITAGAAGEERSWWRGLLYRWLVGPSLDAPEDREPAISWRLAGSEVVAALTGEQATRWQSANAEYTVIASTAVPIMDANNRLHGALVIEQASDALLLATNQTMLRIGFWSLLAMAIAGGVVFVFASTLSLRIRGLRNAVDNSLDDALSGNTNEGFQFVASTRRDEIGDLSRSFAGLLYELREYNHYLRTLAGKLSHELNTPLAVVRSSLENLSHEALDEQASAYAVRARDGVERLQRILRAMSEAQRLEHSIERQDPEWFDLSDVVRGCFDAYRSMDHRHSWQLKGAQQAMRIYGAPELIAQLLDKLTDNARSFCPEQGSITITLSEHPKGALLSVSNSGPTLPEKLRRRLFDSMVSLRDGDGADTHLGLGLHIVRLVARAHRGKVFARNLNDDSGVEIGVLLDGMRLPGGRPADSEQA